MSNMTKALSENRKARFNYEILEQYEAGIVLTGSEVKSIRQGQINLQDSFVQIMDGEAWLINTHIHVYDNSSHFQPDATRRRKLLLHKRQIRKIHQQVKEKGLSLVPLRAYLNNGRIKLAIGIGKGKKLFDKRQSLKEKDLDKQMQRSQRFYH